MCENVLECDMGSCSWCMRAQEGALCAVREVDRACSPALARRCPKELISLSSIEVLYIIPRKTVWRVEHETSRDCVLADASFASAVVSR